VQFYELIVKQTLISPLKKIKYGIIDFAEKIYYSL